MDAAFHFEVVASALHTDVNRAIGPVHRQLLQLDGVGGSAAVDPDHGFVTVVATGGTEQRIVEIWAQRQMVTGSEPALLIAHRNDNALPAALEALARIRQAGGSGHIVMAENPADVVAAIRDQITYHRLRQLRIGIVGRPSDWLVASLPSAEAVHRRWGPTLVDVEPLTVSDRPNVEMVGRLAERWAGMDRSGQVGAAVLEKAAACYSPLMDLVAAHDLDAITVRCFDLISEADTTACVALAEINDRARNERGVHLIAGCEGDIASAMAMVWLRHLLGATSWMANPASIDVPRGEIDLAHCTIAPSLVDDLELTTHFESGTGVGIAGRMPRQPVTLVRLGGVELERAWITDGDLVATGHEVHRCRTQVTVAVPPDRAAELMRDPLGNHLTLVPGHHGRRLQDWWDRFIDVGSAARVG
jgi:L-fucose isomerase-like protein